MNEATIKVPDPGGELTQRIAVVAKGLREEAERLGFDIFMEEQNKKSRSYRRAPRVDLLDHEGGHWVYQVYDQRKSTGLYVQSSDV